MAAAVAYRGAPHAETRKVLRPSYEQLKADLASISFLAVGRKYGVSDNAARKWLRWYEARRNPVDPSAPEEPGELAA